MATAQPWNQFECSIATVNRHPCRTESELQAKLRQVMSGKLGPVEIAIHDPAAQRVFLSLAVYSPKELLPQAVGSFVGKVRRGSTKGTELMEGPAHLEMYLAITTIMNETQSSTARVVCAAVLSALNKGYSKVSFGTTQQVAYPGEKPGAVVIWMQR